MSRRERLYAPSALPADVARLSDVDSLSKEKSRRASRLEVATVIVLNSSLRSALLGGAGESKFHSKSDAKVYVKKVRNTYNIIQVTFDLRASLLVVDFGGSDFSALVSFLDSFEGQGASGTSLAIVSSQVSLAEVSTSFGSLESSMQASWCIRNRYHYDLLP